MKKFLILTTLSILMVMISACGVQRPNPMSIELINATGGIPYAQQGYQAVIAYSLYNVKVDWDVSDTGAQGVDIVVAQGTDYYCDAPIMSTRLYVTNSKAAQATAYYANNSLGEIFRNDIGKFAMGKYAICLKAVMYDSISEPSLPVFLDYRGSEGSGVTLTPTSGDNPEEEQPITE